MKTRQEFFGQYLKYTSVAHSLWRSYECERFAKDKILRPVLDLGCGDGFFAQTVFGHLETGIDLDCGEVSRAVARGAYDKAICDSATKMPFKSKCFRTVVSNCVMEHIPDIDAVLKECHRVLKPGGRVITTVPSEVWDKDSLWQRVFRASGFEEGAQWYNRKINVISKHHHVDEKKVWEARFKKAGLKLVTAEYLMPTEAYHTFERWFIPAIPSKIWKALFKKWVLLPRFWAPGFFNWYFRDLLKKEVTTVGCCYYLVAKKPG